MRRVLKVRFTGLIMLLIIGGVLYFGLLYLCGKRNKSVMRYKRYTKLHDWKLSYLFAYLGGLLIVFLVLFIVSILYVRGAL